MASENDVKKLASVARAESSKKLSKAEIQAANDKAIAAKKAARLADINKRLQLALKTKTENEEIISKADKNSGKVKHVYNGIYRSPKKQIENAEDRIAYLEHQKAMVEHPGLMEKAMDIEKQINVAKKEEQQNNIKDEIQSGFGKVEITQDDLKTSKIYPKEYAKIPKASDFQEASEENPFKDKM